MKPRALLPIGLLAAAFASPATGVSSGDPDRGDGAALQVVMLHGLGRSDRAMRRLVSRFEADGLPSVAIGYDSRSRTIDEIVDDVASEIESCCGGTREVHFVTHSLGGLVLRAWVAQRDPDRLGRVVMLSPPNHGSELVDRLGGLRALLGPTGRELGTGPDSVPSRLNRLGPVPFELGVIAGDRSFNWIGSWILDGRDDGTVSVESARIAGMRDFLVLPATHTFMIRDAEVARQAIHFVRHGRFDAAGSGGRE